MMSLILPGQPVAHAGSADVALDPETGSVLHSGPGLLPGFMPDSPPSYVSGEGTWTGSGPWGGNLRGLAALPFEDEVLVAGCGYSMAPDAGGVWRSTNGGVDWVASDLQAKQVNSVCNSGSGLPGGFYASTRTGLYFSSDEGQTWTQVPGGMSSAYVLMTGVHWTDPDILIAGLSSNQGIRRSADGGQTWATVGLGTGYMKGYGFCIDHPDTMFVAMSGLSNSVYRSLDAGLTWSPVGPAGSGWGLLSSPGGGSNILIATCDGGFYMSTNYGSSWSQVVAGTSYAPAVWADGSLYAPVISSGVYESTNGGVSWTLNQAGITASYWQAGCAGSAGYLAGHSGGVYRRGSGGTYVISQQGISNGFIHAVSYLPGTGLLAGGEAHGLWRSTDGGATWSMDAEGLGNWTIYDLWPESGDQYQGPVVYAATGSGVFRSDDWGSNWYAAGLSGTQVTSVAFDPDDPDRAWAGTASGGMRYTTDGGVGWLSSSGLPAALYPVVELGETPGGGLRVLVSFQQLGTGVYRSDDGGATYSAGSGVSGSYMPCLSYRWDEGAAYCGTDAGVYRSLDFGVTWSLCPGSSGLIWSVLGSRNQNVFAGTNTAGVRWSPDGGDTWQPLDGGIETRCVWDIAYGALDTQLFAGLRGFGVVELSSDALGLEGGGFPSGPALTVVADPSPCTGAVTFALAGLGEGTADVRVFDQTGRLVYGTSASAGSQAVWDASGETPSGVYIVLVREGGRAATARFVVLR